ncbi:MAG TPA: copper chaperone PCu(A)C [Dyella sp.]|uniref:copper chaperone PCu(A)C n=1 Tax=Dyella sp. TaxID=1869338 RepID=UPI002F942F41
MTLKTLLLATLLLPGVALANDAQAIRASAPWIRLLPANLPAGGFVTLLNDSDRDVSLRSASSPSYGSVMLHKSSTEGGMGRMEMVDSLSIPAHGKAMLAPGGYHLMMMNAAKPVAVGDKVKVTLQFGDGSTSTVEFVAKPANTIDGD